MEEKNEKTAVADSSNKPKKESNESKIPAAGPAGPTETEESKVPNDQDKSKVSDKSEVSKESKVPKVSEEPKVSEVSKESKVPKVSEESEVSKVPNEPNEPKYLLNLFDPELRI